MSFTERRIPFGIILAAALVLPLSSNLLLWRFLNFAPTWLYLAGMIGAAFIVYAIWRSCRAIQGPTLIQVGACALVALVVFVAGGEGRLLYSNFDWQVRDAVLRDMALNPWPFAYRQLILRAPIGMYLLPALAGKAWGLQAMDYALLIQNSAFLAAILSLAASLFKTFKDRALGLLVVIFFSGMDVLGRLALELRDIQPAEIEAGYHIEGWANLQFSSHVTQAFWVPQHALPGWLGAVLFLLWSHGLLRLWVFLAPIPVLLLWSPLSTMGLLPFAAYAAFKSMRQLSVADFVLPGLALALSVPALLYLGAAGDAVGFHGFAPSLLQYVVFQTLEVIPFLVAVWLLRNKSQSPAIIMITGAWLLVLPFVKIGTSVDFMMRASIPALAILSVYVVEALKTKDQRFVRYALIAGLLVGSVTPLLEIGRAFLLRPSPMTTCSLIGIWNRVEGLVPGGPTHTYFAPLEKIPNSIKPSFVTQVEPLQPSVCWSRRWQTRRF